MGLELTGLFEGHRVMWCADCRGVSDLPSPLETGNSDNQSFDTDRNRLLLFFVVVNGNTMPVGKIIGLFLGWLGSSILFQPGTTGGLRGVLFPAAAHARALIGGSGDNRESWRPDVRRRTRITFLVLFRCFTQLSILVSGLFDRFISQDPNLSLQSHVSPPHGPWGDEATPRRLTTGSNSWRIHLVSPFLNLLPCIYENPDWLVRSLKAHN